MSTGVMWMAVLLGTSVPTAAGDQPVVTVAVTLGRGPVGPALVKEKVQRKRAALLACYRAGAFQRPNGREGRLAFDLGIARTGQVRFAQVKADTLRSPKTRSCVTGTLRRLMFPAAPKASRARVTLYFRVRSATQATLTLYGWEAGRGIDVAMVRRVLRSGHSRYLACFTTYARKQRGPVAGTVRLRLRVSRRGIPQAVSAQGGTLVMPRARRCIGRIVRTLRFPAPPRRPVWVGVWMRFRKL